MANTGVELSLDPIPMTWQPVPSQMAAPRVEPQTNRGKGRVFPLTGPEQEPGMGGARDGSSMREDTKSQRGEAGQYITC